MLSCSSRAAVKPFTASKKCHVVLVGTAVSARLHAARRSVRLQAQDDNSTKTQESSSSQQQQPQEQMEELPIWVRREKERELQAAATKGELPWPLYLLFSVIVAIAAVGSIFEYFDRTAVFGVVPPESPLWAPILGLFAFTGIPTAGFLFFKGVNAANEAAERQDKLDGYIK